MVERVVQSLSQINDSGNFDGSFEVKHIQSPQQHHKRHRCITELDREKLMQFVHEFECRQIREQQQRNSINNNKNNISDSTRNTPKGSPFLCRKAKSFYQNAFVSSRSSSPKPCDVDSNGRLPEDDFDKDYEQMSFSGGEGPHATPSTPLQRAQPERSSLRSAAKLLQIFSAKKKGKQPKWNYNNNCNSATANTNCSLNSSRSSSATGSPVLLRAQLGCQPLPSSDAEDDEHDDGISSASSSNFTRSSNYSRHGSPDSSFEMHPPLVPTFKVTPPQLNKTNRNPAYEFARFLRGSFHAKRANITTLRRSMSDPDNYQKLDFTKPATMNKTKKTIKILNNKSELGKQRVSQPITTNPSTDTTNVKFSDAISNRVVPTANASPFSRAWVHSSFRTPRTDKFAVHAHNQQTSPHKAQGTLVRRTASMTASDNDVYIKSMDDFIDELKQTHSQQQIDSFGRIDQIMPSKIANSNISINRSGSGCSSTTTTNNNNTKKSLGSKLLPQIKVIETAGQAQSDGTSEGTAGVRAWGTSFERLLEDPAGLHTFAEFLKKEFSAENIYFWTACERFRSLDDPAERMAQAQFIYTKHLANGSSEPVNVDSQARNLNEEKLQAAELDIFAPAQKQIFNLMKFDSYQRFIRSDLYKSCLDAEEKHQPLPYGADDLDELLRTHSQQGAASKLKKSASNAEDRRRKSLLPWHRKTRSKSRDGADSALAKPTIPVKHNPKAHLSSSSLKIPATSQHSGSDVHSSRSSLSSFDSAFPSSAVAVSSHLTAAADAACSLCRVILSDGATTIVQTRSGETVAQLIERLLEKRGLNYKFYNVVESDTGKSIELQRAAMTLAGKQVLIEQGVAFKLDLPDPKVISVKSKPKKQLHEVIRPILNKYNYTMDAVQVLRRDTQLPLDLSLPVTVADGQRLQIVLVKQPAIAADYQNGGCTAKYIKPASGFANVGLKHPTRAAAGHAAAAAAAHQSTLDEITNKVFNELLQGKVQSHNMSSVQANDLCSIKSDDCGSENSSIFERMRRREVNVSGFKLKSKKKSTSSQQSEENSMANAPLAMPAPQTAVDVKKPIIAKLKAGVRLQVTERVAENQDELLEGLKRAQLARLEDQRGTEINFELPDFLKNKENQLSAAASKLRKVRANLSPVTKTNPNQTPTDEVPPSPSPFALMTGERPQPAPRLSIANRNKVAAAATLVSPMKVDESASEEAMLETVDYLATATGGAKGPPPLPPKPKVLPIKPNNWGVCSANNSANTTPTNATNALLSTPTTPTASMSGATLSIAGKLNVSDATAASPRCAYLEEPSSSFV